MPNSEIGGFSVVRTHTLFALRFGVRERSVIWLGAMFMGMVLLSAYLGWSASHAIDQIYVQAVQMLQRQGSPIPANPVADLPPLAMLRNMTTYVSLLGALATLVLGVQLVAQDRRSGCFPLIASRPASPYLYALGKVIALALIVAGLLAVASVVNALSVWLLPGPALTGYDLSVLFGFYVVSGLFLMAFGLMGLASGAWFRSESLSLLVPVAAWLFLTFVLPQVSANINPMAAMNPIKAMVAPPTGAFFQIVGPVLAPFSLTSNFRDISAALLGFSVVNSAALSPVLAWGSLLLTNAILVVVAVRSLAGLDPTRSHFDA